jgi:hypothetical protein
MALVDESDREFFRNNGYVKIENAVPAEDCEAVIEDIHDHTGWDRDDPETWYDPPRGMDEPFSSSGMVEMYHRQSMWDVRQHPRVYQAFAELLEEETLWVSIDRVNMTPPRREDHPELSMGFVHWDADLSGVPTPIPQPYGVQGVVYLDDTSAEQGGFCCVPELYREIDDEWLENRRANREDPNALPAEELEDYEVEFIPGEQGDLVIWDRMTPHGNGENDAEDPRYAQYVLMERADFADVEQREGRIESWRESKAPAGDAFGGDPRRLEAETGPAELTPLGRKLLGLDPWQGWRTRESVERW